MNAGGMEKPEAVSDVYGTASGSFTIAVFLYKVCNLIKKTFCILPAKAWVGDGFSVNMFADFLVSGFNIAFHHHALYKGADVLGNAAAVENFLDNAWLLGIILV